ncbi:hypothetical protein OUZ56_000257 [Daphnia magna]|uniref:Uncharacterized protein n=1 Tax=Daphnia magna TaxID=35525 RepID=A0ABQ9ZZY7_9CRUS|nr:hypothetical protein OUZ56_000257 [Daphnia magna]
MLQLLVRHLWIARRFHIDLQRFRSSLHIQQENGQREKCRALCGLVGQPNNIVNREIFISAVVYSRYQQFLMVCVCLLNHEG